MLAQAPLVVGLLFFESDLFFFAMIAAMLDMIMILSINAAAVSETRSNMPLGASPDISKAKKTDLVGVETRHKSLSSELFSLIQGERSGGGERSTFMLWGSIQIFSVNGMLFGLVILGLLLAAVLMQMRDDDGPIG